MSQIRVLIIFDVGDGETGLNGWAYLRRAMALKKHCPNDIEIVTVNAQQEKRANLSEFDLVFNLDYANSEPMSRRCRGAKTPLVTSFNKDHNSRVAEFKSTIYFSDYVIINNRDRWIHGNQHPKTCCIANGVDLDIFGIDVPIEERPLRALWTGSSGPAKKKRYQELISKLPPHLEEAGIDSSFRPINHVPSPDVFTPEQMRAWYNSGTFILCASETEGTPNTTLEGMTCGCVPITTWVANIQEMGQHGVNAIRCEPSVYEFARACVWAKEPNVMKAMSANARKTIVEGGWSWADRSQYFYALFRRVAKGEFPKSFSYQTCRPEDI